MAIAMLVDNPSGSQEVYDKVRANLGFSEDELAEGGIVHVAGPSPNGGWRVIEVWESQEAMEKFVAERLGPALKEAGVERPEPQRWEVYNLVKR